MYSKEARTLGEALDAGHQLYVDLQRIYFTNMKQKTDQQKLEVTRNHENNNRDLELLLIQNKDNEEEGYVLEIETPVDQNKVLLECHVTMKSSAE